MYVMSHRLDGAQCIVVSLAFGEQTNGQRFDIWAHHFKPINLGSLPIQMV